MISIGSHNTMSYKSPENLFLKPFKFLARCQSKDYKEQYESGARCFDLRINFKDSGKIEYRHGIFSYDASDIEEVLKFFNEKKVYVRVFLEEPFKEDLYKEYTFELFCSKLETTYPKIKFFGGTRKFDGKILFEFKNNSPEIISAYSSQCSLFNSDSKFLKIIDDWWSWIYAKIMNKKNLEKYKDYSENIYLFIDFI